MDAASSSSHPSLLEWVDTASSECLPNEVLERVFLFVAGSVRSRSEACTLLRTLNLVSWRWHLLAMRWEFLESVLTRGGLHLVPSSCSANGSVSLTWVLSRDGPPNVVNRVPDRRVHRGKLPRGHSLPFGPQVTMSPRHPAMAYATVHFHRLVRRARPVQYMRYEGIVKPERLEEKMRHSEYFYNRRIGRAKDNHAEYISVRCNRGSGEKKAKRRCKMMRRWFQPLLAQIARRFFSRPELFPPQQQQQQ